MNYNVTSAGSLDSALNKADAVFDERRSNMKKRMAMTLTALALSVIMAIPAYAGTWKYVNDQWKYQRGANKFAYNEWVKDNGNWYYLDKDGYMKTGWQQINGVWYYMDQSGVMQNGWFKDNDKWYFLLPNGAMAVNTTIDGRQIGQDGVWIPAEGQVEPANTMDLNTPYLLQNMSEGLSTKGYNIITSGKNASGERWTNAIRLKGKGSYVKYDTKGGYKLLAGAVAPSSQFDSGLMAKITVYGDNDTVLYTSPDIHYNEKTIYFGADITGQDTVRVEVSLVTDNFYDNPVILMDGLAVYK